MSRETGRVIAVTSSLAGDELAADAPTGATQIYVVDAADFSEDGGQLQITTDDGTGTDWTSVPYDYTAVDDETGLITLAAPLILAADAGDRVEVFDPTSGSLAQETVAHVMLEGSSFNDDAVEAVVDHALTPYLPEGIREEGEGEVVALEWRGEDLRVADVLDQAPRLDGGEAGWLLGTDGASFDTLAVTGELGASQVTADGLTIAGDEFHTVLDRLPKGLIALGRPVYSTNTALITTTETVAFRFTIGSVRANRMYRISFLGALTVNAVTDDVYLIKLRYTKDGTTPTATSEVLDYSAIKVAVPNGAEPTSFRHSFVYNPVLDYDTVRLALTLVRSAGTGSGQIKVDDANYGFEMVVEDIGLQDLVGGTLAQISKTSGTPDTSDTGTYTRTFGATWGQSYDGDGGKRDGEPNTPDLYQGYYSRTHGNTRSMVGFDDAAIRAALAGATNITVKLTFRVKHAYPSYGMSADINQHNMSSAPSTYSSIPSGAELLGKAGCKTGSTYTVTLPASFGTALKNGTARGIAFGPPALSANVYYGYMYGVGSGSAPKLTITYSK